MDEQVRARLVEVAAEAIAAVDDAETASDHSWVVSPDGIAGYYRRVGEAVIDALRLEDLTDHPVTNWAWGDATCNTCGLVVVEYDAIAEHDPAPLFRLGVLSLTDGDHG